MSVKVLTQQRPLQPKLPIPSGLYKALGAEEEKRVGTHLHAVYIELAHMQTHASYREVHSPREVAM